MILISSTDTALFQNIPYTSVVRAWRNPWQLYAA